MTGVEILMGAMAAMSAVGGVVGAMGASQQASAAAAAGQYNAAALEQSAQAADRNAKIARDQAELEKRDADMKNRAIRGQIRSAYGSSGLSIDGSPLDVLEATTMEQELDVEKILYKGDIQALDQEDRARSFRSQAQLARMGASSAITAGSFGVATSLLSGATGALKSFTPSARYGGSGAAAP